jgi:hypothetical protein
MFTYFRAKSSRLALPRDGNRMQSDTIERKGDRTLLAPVHSLVHKRLQPRPALSRQMRGNAVRPIRGR